MSSYDVMGTSFTSQRERQELDDVARAVLTGPHHDGHILVALVVCEGRINVACLVTTPPFDSSTEGL